MHLQNLKIESDDILLTHFLTYDKRPNAKNVVLACHEKWWFEVGEINKYWDNLVFSHEEHRKYHSKEILNDGIRNILTSTDGKNWATTLGGFPNFATGVAWTETNWIATGGSSTTTLMRSPTTT